MHNSTVKILQITDTHLFADHQQTMYGIHTNQRFEQVITAISHQPKDIIFLTGDISQDETPASYHYAAEQLNALNTPIYWIAGNHDCPEHLHEVFSQYSNFIHAKTLDLAPWRFIFLDSNTSGSDAGFLSQQEQEKLSKSLSSTHKNIVVVHHNPIPVATPIIDHYIMSNGEVLTQHNNIEMVLIGHVHGDYTIQHKQFILESGIATCLQWQKGAKEITFDLRFGYTEYLFSPTEYQKTVHWLNPDDSK